MGWLNDWLGELGEAPPKPTAPLPIAKPKPRRRSEIKMVLVQTRQPIDSDDPGAAEPGFYSVSDGVLTMHDASGKPTGKEYVLGPDDDPGIIAKRLTLQAWIKGRGESDFLRPLVYAPLGIV